VGRRGGWAVGLDSVRQGTKRVGGPLSRRAQSECRHARESQLQDRRVQRKRRQHAATSRGGWEQLHLSSPCRLYHASRQELRSFPLRWPQRLRALFGGGCPGWRLRHWRRRREEYEGKKGVWRASAGGYAIYLLYWYKSTNTDAKGALLQAAYDPCYHQECDDTLNINLEELGLMSRALAHTLELLVTDSDLRQHLNYPLHPTHGATTRERDTPPPVILSRRLSRQDSLRAAPLFPSLPSTPDVLLYSDTHTHALPPYAGPHVVY
jgi:hypothetical protein